MDDNDQVHKESTQGILIEFILKKETGTYAGHDNSSEIPPSKDEDKSNQKVIMKIKR